MGTYFSNATITIAQKIHSDTDGSFTMSVKYTDEKCTWLDKSGSKDGVMVRGLGVSDPESNYSIIDIDAKIIITKVTLDINEEYVIKYNNLYYKIENIKPFPAIIQGYIIEVTRDESLDIEF